MTTLDPYDMTYDERREVVNAMLMITEQDIEDYVAADDETEEARDVD